MDQIRINELLKKMTLEEKIAQLVQLDGSLFSKDAAVTGPKAKLGLSDETIDNIGSIYNVFGAEKLKKIQTEYLEKNRLKIPLLFCADIIYGYKTILPIPLAFACSWNPMLVKQGFGMIANEASAAGVHGVFAPMVDLVRDPRWGRVMESTGEDVYLNQQFAKAEVEGFQDHLDQFHVASCVKHFAGYGAPEAGREYNTVDMSERKFREQYLPSYMAAVDAGCKMVMTSFNTVDGIPSSGNSWLMRDILRGEWKFDGVVVSDYAAIQELICHGVASNESEAAKLAIEAGVDLDMKTPVYANYLKKLILDGTVDIALLDEAVMRILKLKNELGLFEDPFRGIDQSFEEATLCAKHHMEMTKQIADESIVLLKNEKQVLPLDSSKKIALIGPYGKEKSLTGLWAFTADFDQIITLKEAMEEKGLPDFSYAHGCDILDDYSVLGEFGFMAKSTAEQRDPQADWEEACKVAEEADVIVMALGEHMMQSGEAASRTEITIHPQQLKLLKKMRSMNRPIVTILFNGRPLVLADILDQSDAILEAWFPGSQGARSIVDILFGKVNPSGKLTMTFPVNVGQIPIYYNEFKTGRPLHGSGHTSKFVSKYLDAPNTPQFPFGYGLSYSTFSYGEIKLSNPVLKDGETIVACIEVENTSSIAGKEIVQLYIQDVIGSTVRPVKELKGFQKIELKAGEKKKISFEIAVEDLKFYGRSMKFEAEKGSYIVYIGTNSQEVSETMFEYC